MRVGQRDIKPENILLDTAGRVRVADFGLSKALGDRTASSLTGSRAMGTPMYMAPEQLADPHHADHRVDLWAVGIMLYEMLTGQLPLGRFAPASRLVATPRGTDAVLERALQPDPAARFQDAGEVKRQLDALPVTALRPKSATDASTQRDRWWVFAAGMLPCWVIFAAPAWGAARPVMGIGFVGLVLALSGYRTYEWMRYRGEPRGVRAEAVLATVALMIGVTMLSGFDFFGETFGIQALSPAERGTRVAWQTLGALVTGAAALVIATAGQRHGVRGWSLFTRGRLDAR